MQIRTFQRHRPLRQRPPRERIRGDSSSPVSAAILTLLVTFGGAYFASRLAYKSTLSTSLHEQRRSAFARILSSTIHEQDKAGSPQLLDFWRIYANALLLADAPVYEALVRYAALVEIHGRWDAGLRTAQGRYSELWGDLLTQTTPDATSRRLMIGLEHATHVVTELRTRLEGELIPATESKGNHYTNAIRKLMAMARGDLVTVMRAACCDQL